MDICRLFHKKSKKRKEQKILLITQSFQQSPQVFPQGFSTGGACCGYAVLVHIKRSDTLRRISHFSAGRGFYHEHFFVQKLGLDNSPRRPRRPPTGAGWPGRSFLGNTVQFGKKSQTGFLPQFKVPKMGNTVCIPHLRNCRSGAKRRLRLADAIVRCCPYARNGKKF